MRKIGMRMSEKMKLRAGAKMRLETKVLSIIIPVYNAGKYLENCLDSILRRVLDTQYEVAVEILLVNNNSTDISEKIIARYAENYPQVVRKFNYETPGAAAVRNYGVRKARGEYIWFVDADDELEDGAIEKMFGAMREHTVEEAGFTGIPDVITFGVTKRFLDGTRRPYTPVLPMVDSDWRNRYVMYGFGPFQNVYRYEFWTTYMGGFPEGMIHEDMAILSTPVLYTEKILGLDEYLYIYYERPGSVLHPEKFEAKIFDIFPALGELYGRFEAAHVEYNGQDFRGIELYREAVEYFFIWNLLIDAHEDFVSYPEGRVGLVKTREFLKQYFPNWQKNRYLRKKSWKMRLKCRLNYYLPF